MILSVTDRDPHARSPHGKKTQRIDLLSGGSARTALSLCSAFIW
jgi:hypothetical protein